MMTMTLQKFSGILDRRGADAQAWPVVERAACHSLLETSPEARKLLREHQQLAQALDQLQVPALPGLEARVLNQSLPARTRSLLDHLLDWLLPGNLFGPRIWRPAMVACLPLVIGILVGNYFSFGVATENQGFEYWDDELYVLSLNDYTENLF